MNCLEHVFFKPRPRPSGLRRSDPDRDLTLFFPVQVSVTFHYYSDGHVAGLQRTAKSSHRHSRHVIRTCTCCRLPACPRHRPLPGSGTNFSFQPPGTSLDKKYHYTGFLNSIDISNLYRTISKIHEISKNYLRSRTHYGPPRAANTPKGRAYARRPGAAVAAAGAARCSCRSCRAPSRPTKSTKC